MDISMDIHGKSVDMDMDMDGKFHIHGKPAPGDGGTIAFSINFGVSKTFFLLENFLPKVRNLELRFFIFKTFKAKKNLSRPNNVFSCLWESCNFLSP